MSENLIKKLEEIKDLAWTIRGDWTDPRHECREIVRIADEAINEIKK